MAGKIVTIAQQKGGSGKTTIAANLAVALSARGQRVAILDTDPQGSLGRWLMNRREAFGDTVHELGFRTASAWGARYEARELLREHDLVIIDTPPKMGVDGRPAIEVADLIIIPVTPSQVDLWATEPTIELAGAEKKPVMLVLNRASTRTRITGEVRQLLDQMEGRVADIIVGNRVAFAEAMGTGLGVIERQPSRPAAKEIDALASEVSAALG